MCKEMFDLIDIVIKYGTVVIENREKYFMNNLRMFLVKNHFANLFIR